MKKLRGAAVVVCAVLATVALCGCIVVQSGNPGPTGDPGNTPVGQGGEGTSTNSPYAPGGKTPAGHAAPAVKVELGFDFARQYDDPAIGTMQLFYALPHVTGPDTQYIEDINKLVGYLRTDYVDPSMAAASAGESVGIIAVDYTTGKAGNITSLLVSSVNAYVDIPEFWCWLIDENGNPATNEELFAAKGVKAADVLARVESCLMQDLGHFDYDALADIYGKEVAEISREVRDRTLSADNINTDMPFFLNEAGELCVVATIYLAVGGGYEFGFYNLGL